MNNNWAQNNLEEKNEILTTILSDTLNPEIYLIPILIKFKGDTTTWVGYKNALVLFNYFRNEYSWNKDFFIKQMNSNFLDNKIFETKDTAFFSKNHLISITECDCLSIDNIEIIKKLIINRNHYKYDDNRFSCFVYESLKKNLILAIIEGQLVFKKSN